MERKKMNMKKKLRLKQSVKNFLIIGTLYLVIICGVLLLGERTKQINNQLKMTEIAATIQSKNENF